VLCSSYTSRNSENNLLKFLKCRYNPGMPEIRTVTTLVAKRDEIEAAITNYERRLEQAGADLSHVNAVISIFEAAGDRDTTTAYTDIHRLFQRGDLTAICKAALAQHGPMNTRALVTHILAAATGLASHSCALTTGAAPRLRDFNHASLSAIRSARSAKSGSSSIIGARATSTTTTARHATQAVAIPIQMSISTSSIATV